MDEEKKKQMLWDTVVGWIQDNKVRAPESICQRDDVQESLCELGEAVCIIIGYYKDDEHEI